MKITNPSILFWLVTALAPSYVTADCHPGSAAYTHWDTGVGNNGHFYKHVVGNALSWANAEAAAETMTICDGVVKGHLATLTTADEDAFVFNQVNLYGYDTPERGPWLGGFQPANSDEPPFTMGRQWVTGEVWSYTNWAGDEPKNILDDQEDCLQIVRLESASDLDKWNDDVCTRSSEYIVEFSGGATYHIGGCDTGVLDPTYDMCLCSSPHFDAVAACTTMECVGRVGGLLQATKDAITRSQCMFTGIVSLFSF
jgi:hypothetical protein